MWLTGRENAITIELPGGRFLDSFDGLALEDGQNLTKCPIFPSFTELNCKYV